MPIISTKSVTISEIETKNVSRKKEKIKFNENSNKVSNEKRKRPGWWRLQQKMVGMIKTRGNTFFAPTC